MKNLVLIPIAVLAVACSTAFSTQNSPSMSPSEMELYRAEHKGHPPMGNVDAQKAPASGNSTFSSENELYRAEHKGHTSSDQNR
jgi:ABC-type oligopeptide transport system substrate-binding subunit